MASYLSARVRAGTHACLATPSVCPGRSRQSGFLITSWASLAQTVPDKSVSPGSVCLQVPPSFSYIMQLVPLPGVWPGLGLDQVALFLLGFGLLYISRQRPVDGVFRPPPHCPNRN